MSSFFSENQQEVVVSHVSKTVKKHARVTHEEQKLYQKLIQARIKLSKCRQKVKKQSISLKTAKKLTSNPVLLATMEKLHPQSC